MGKPKQPFGVRGVYPPPVVTQARAGLPGAPGQSPLRKSSVTVGLITAGVVALGGAAYLESHRRSEACRTNPTPENCRQSSSSGGHWYFGSSSSSSDSGSHSSSSTPHATYGGFGHAGAAHAGGGS